MSREEHAESAPHENHQKRRRWDGHVDRLPYETERFDGGEKVRLTYRDFGGSRCAVDVEVGEYMSHNSWLLLFDDDGSGDEHIVRADGVVLLQTYPDEEISEIGYAERVEPITMADGGRAEHGARTHRVVIAQCTDGKRSGQHRAVDLYEPSRLFRAQRRYAEAYADKWFILSAKHGLIHPTQLVSSYDMEISEQYSERWQETLDWKIERITRGDVHVEVIAGGDYLQRLEWYLDHYDVDYSVPFDGQRYAIRIQNMVEAAREVENHSLEVFA